jgi:mono/diheme cytochrome c family protein
MKRFLFGFLATIGLLLAGGGAYLKLGLADVRADVAAPKWESRMMQSAVHASVQRSASKGPSPLSHTNADLIAGGKLYLDGCAGCHSRPGRPRRKSVYFFPPPEFAHEGTQYSEPELCWIIQHGIRRTGMSAYGDYSKTQLWTIAAFVERMRNLPPPVLEALQPKKP